MKNNKNSRSIDIEKIIDIFFNFSSTLEETQKQEFLFQLTSLSDFDTNEKIKRLRPLILTALSKSDDLHVIQSVNKFITDYGSKLQFQVEDNECLVYHLLKNKKEPKEKCKEAFIAAYSYIERLDPISKKFVSIDCFDTEFYIFLIERTSNEDIAKSLFEKILNLELTEPLARNVKVKRVLDILESELKSKDSMFSISKLALFSLRISYSLIIIDVINRLFDTRCFDKNINLFFQTVPTNLPKQDFGDPFLELFKHVLKDYERGTNDNFISKVTSHLVEWINTQVIPESDFLQLLCEVNFTKCHPQLPRVIAAIAEKSQNKRSMKQLITLIPRKTVPPYLSIWFMTFIIGWMREERRETDKILEQMHLSIVEDNNNLVNCVYMLLAAVKCEVDVYRVGEQFGFVQVINLINKATNTETVIRVSLHPFHTSRRIYAEIAKVLDSSFDKFTVQYINGNQYVPLKIDTPLSELPISYHQPMTIAYIKEKSDNINHHSAFLEALVKHEIFRFLFDYLENNNSLAESIYLVFQLFEKPIVYNQFLSELQKLVVGKPVPSLTFCKKTRVFPYVLLGLANDNVEVDINFIEKSFIAIQSSNYDLLSLEICCSSLKRLASKCDFSPGILKSCLIECEQPAIRKAIIDMISPDYDLEKYISHINLTILHENRYKTNEYFSCSILEKIPVSIADSFFVDMEPFETFNSGFIDMTFINLLKFISKSKNNIDIVYHRLFMHPTMKCLDGMFCKSIESREAALKFLLSCDCFDIINELARKIPDDRHVFSFNGSFNLLHSNLIANNDSRSPLSGILQILASSSHFMEPFISTSDLTSSDIDVKCFFNVLMRLRYGRFPVSIRRLLSCKYFSILSTKSPENAFNTMITLLQNENILRSFICNIFISKLDYGRYNMAESQLVISLDTSNSRNLFESLDILQAKRPIKQWPRLLVFSCTTSRKKIFEFPIILPKLNNMPSYIFLGSIILCQKGSSPTYYSTLIRNEDNVYYLIENDEIKIVNPTEVSDYCFGNTLKDKVRYLSSMIFYSESVNSSPLTISRETEEEYDSILLKQWPLFVCSTDSFSNFAMQLYKQEPDERRDFFLFYFFNYTISTSKIKEWAEVTKSTILCSEDGRHQFIELFLSSNIDLIAGSSKKISEYIPPLIIESIKSRDDRFYVFTKICRILRGSSNNNCYSLMVSLSELYLNEIGFNKDDKSEALEFIRILSMKKPKITFDTCDFSHGMFNILMTYVSNNIFGSDEEGLFIQNIFNDHFLLQFRKIAMRSEAFNNIIKYVSTKYPEYTAMNVSKYPFLEIQSNMHTSGTHSFEPTSIREKVTKYLFSENEVERNKAFETLYPMFAPKNPENYSFLKSAFLSGKSDKKFDMLETGFSHYILSLLDTAMKFRTDPTRIEQYIKALKIISYNCPTLVSRHVSTIIELITDDKSPFYVKIIRIIANIMAVDSIAFEYVCNQPEILEVRKPCRASVQILCALGDKASKSSLSASAIEYCLQNQYSDTTHAVIKLLKNGFVPGNFSVNKENVSPLSINLLLILREVVNVEKIINNLDECIESIKVNHNDIYNILIGVEYVS